MEIPLGCPHCDALNDDHENQTGKRAVQSGDWSICWSCGGVSRFVRSPYGWTLRLLAADDEAEMIKDQQLVDKLAAIRKARLLVKGKGRGGGADPGDGESVCGVQETRGPDRDVPEVDGGGGSPTS